MSENEPKTSATWSVSGRKTVRRQLLEEAADTIDGDRNDQYGEPEANFNNIARLWNARFAHMLFGEEKFTAADVAEAMILVKVARNISHKKRDTYVDIAGYAACAQECVEAETNPTVVSAEAR